MPEALVIKQSTIESPLDILISTVSSNYKVNKDLNLVFDDNTNKEYQELQDKFTLLTADSSRMSVTKLPNIDLLVRTPSNVEVSYNNPNAEFNPYAGYRPSYNKCYTINAGNLKPTTEVTDCKSYTITYKVETDSRLLGLSRIFTVYKNSYPNDLVGNLNSRDTLKEHDIKMLEQNLKLIEINSSGYKTYYNVVRADSGDIYVIYSQKYPGYQIPIEIVELEEHLMFKVLETIKYEEQEDIIPVSYANY